MSANSLVAIITKNRTNSAYVGARSGADRVLLAHALSSVHFVPEKPDDIVEQCGLIRQAVKLRPNAMVLAPTHATKMNDALEEVHAADIPLFCVVSEPEPSSAVTFVGSDDWALARDMAIRLAKHLGERGDIVIINGHPDASTSAPRAAGFRDGLTAFPGITIRAERRGYYQRDPAAEAFEQLVGAQGVPDGVLTANDFMARGIWDVLESRETTSIVVSANATPEGVSMIKDGRILASAAFDAMSMAGLAAEAAVRYLRGETVPRSMMLPAILVDQDNLEYWDRPYEVRSMYPWDDAVAKCVVP